MSIDRHIQIDYNVPFSKNDIKSILEKIQHFGCSIRIIEPKKHQDSLSLDEMATRVFKGENEIPIQGSFKAHFDGADFYISFLQNLTKTTTLSIMFSRSYWKKKFKDGEECDLARYVNFMLSISEPLPIKSIKIYYE